MCIDVLRKQGCPGTWTLPCSVRLSARGCWFDEVMSGLQAEGNGNGADLGPSLENQALPFLPFLISKWLLDLCF